jgi:hypothetical protein
MKRQHAGTSVLRHANARELGAPPLFADAAWFVREANFGPMGLDLGLASLAVLTTLIFPSWPPLHSGMVQWQRQMEVSKATGVEPTWWPEATRLARSVMSEPCWASDSLGVSIGDVLAGSSGLGPLAGACSPG